MGNAFNLISQKFISLLDRVNDRFTSYRLVLYYLLALIVWAVIGSFSKQVPFNWHQILISAVWLLVVCWLVNKALSRFLDIPANKESDLITALILALILSPPADTHGYIVNAVAGVAAIASKYIITLRKSHIFNPAAAGAFVSGELLQQFPSWWVGTKFMTPLVVVGGILVLRKVKRFQMVGLFLAVFILYLIFGSSAGSDGHFLWLEIISTQALFFAIIMLSEPLTSPAVARYFLPYAVLVALLYSITKLKLSPEEALLIGNLFTFMVAANRRYELKFIRRLKEADGIYSYAFSMPPKFSFQPGQYMEWTIARNKTDSRGNRRYLTISSSPTEPGLMFTVKHPPKASAFKQRLDKLKTGDKILASRLAGSFTLPKDPSKKIALMAGGVGITPFRSMVKYMIDNQQTRDTALLYSANSPQELSFQKLFEKAADLGLKTDYVTDGRIDAAKIKKLLPDYADRRFYVSGPYGFVNGVESALLKLGVGYDNIVTDYFPGYGG
jgi:ferredoxin-NADP reductase